MKLALSAIGLCSLLFIVNDYGFYKIVTDLTQIGWWTLPLVLSFVPVLFLYSLAWKLVTPEKSWKTLPKLFRLMIVSIAWNNLSPFVKVLGEPMKITALTPAIGRRAALKSVLIYNLVHLYGTAMAFIIGAAILLWHYNVPAAFRLGFLFLLIGLFTALTAAYSLPHLKKKSGKKRKKGLLRRVSLWLHWSLSKIRVFNKKHFWRFVLAIFFETLARFVEGLTFFISFHALAKPISLSTAALLDVGRALLDNLFFFIPYQVGSREAGLILLTEKVMKLNDCPQVSAAILYRLVEVVWILVGYFLWISSSRPLKS